MLRLKEIRKAKNMTQTDVARFLNIARASYVNIENEKRDPDTQTICALADFFGVSVDYLIGRAEQNQPLAEGEGLKGRIISLLDSLSPAELQRVDDFLSGLKSGQREHGSPRP